MTPQVGKWYLTREGKAVKILHRYEWGYYASNNEVYTQFGWRMDGREHPQDLDMERGPIEPATEELALFALECLWTSHDNAGGAAFQWTPEEVSAVMEALTKAGRLGS